MEINGIGHHDMVEMDGNGYDNCFASDSDGSVFLLKVKFDEVLAKLFAACIGIEKAEISQRRYAKTHTHTKTAISHARINMIESKSQLKWETLRQWNLIERSAC